MGQHQEALTAGVVSPSRLAGLLVVVALVAAVPRPSRTTSASSTAPPPGAALERGPRPTPSGSALGPADGIVPRGTTAFADDVPAVVRLDPALLDALRRAASAASKEGVTIVIDSGWRSPRYQAQLLRDAVATYGSAEAAARWVATPDRSAHVAGDAVDVGPARARTWLAAHGRSYGLCPTYRNEPWHFELRPEAARRACPRPYADPSQDPRLQA